MYCQRCFPILSQKHQQYQAITSNANTRSPKMTQLGVFENWQKKRRSKLFLRQNFFCDKSPANFLDLRRSVQPQLQLLAPVEATTSVCEATCSIFWKFSIRIGHTKAELHWRPGRLICTNQPSCGHEVPCNEVTTVPCSAGSA